ncbi:uncharacterized protein TNCV_708601 [Trichonephila clavipes]|nr:uncharacterized protein TNCV_708601 [Trichonephila clavipes]
MTEQGFYWGSTDTNRQPRFFSTNIRSGGSIRIWGMFCWHEKDAMVFLGDKQTTLKYLDILADQVHPATLNLFPYGDEYFMDDNAAIHHARSVQNWFAEHQSDFQHLP